MRNWRFITGAKLPFGHNKIYISQPTMKELSEVFETENDFLKIIQVLNHTRETLKKQVGEDIPVENNYYVFLSILNTQTPPGARVFLPFSSIT